MNQPFSRAVTPRSSRPVGSIAATALIVAAATWLAGCSALDSATGNQVDYRSAQTRQAPLDVPPDLTQLSRDTRFAPQGSGGVVSASSFQAPPAGASASGSGVPPVAVATVPPGSATATPSAPGAQPAVARSQVGAVRLEREGNQRWIVTPQSPEQIWPLLQAFWKDNGFVLAVDDPAAGVMQTEWAENQAKLPQDVLRYTLGRWFSGLYSTGERDLFRTRVERTAGGGAEIYVTHRGLEEVYIEQTNVQTRWQPRPQDPELEAIMLSRLMTKLGGEEKPGAAGAAGTAAPAASGRARALADAPGAALQVDAPFDRAWRRVGLALDRSGYTVEDRDRAQGVYFIRVMPEAPPAEKGLLSGLFSSSTPPPTPATRLRVLVKGDGDRSTVSVLNAQGAPDASETARRIVTLLVDDLK